MDGLNWKYKYYHKMQENRAILDRENRFRAYPGVYAIELLLVFLKKTV
jgi:hypothetical protein